MFLFHVAHLQCSPSRKATKGFQFISWVNIRKIIGKNGVLWGMATRFRRPIEDPVCKSPQQVHSVHQTQTHHKASRSLWTSQEVSVRRVATSLESTTRWQENVLLFAFPIPAECIKPFCGRTVLHPWLHGHVEVCLAEVENHVGKRVCHLV